MRRGKTVLLVVLIVLSVSIFSAPLYALTIRIGSVASPGSPWERTLQKLGREWEKITRGKVKIEIWPGERIGSEYDMIKEMRNGKLEGAAFYNRGLPRICPESYVFTVPLVITSKKEHDYIFNKMKPLLEKKIETQGFKMVTWSLSGWLKLFSRYPVFYPEDIQKHKLSLTTWNPEIEEGWRDLGFHVVPTDFKDLKMALQNNMVDAFFLSPQVAESGQYFTLAPNMCEQTVAPEYWCIVLTQKTWDNIPVQYKTQMEEIAQKLSEDLYEEIVLLEKKAVADMEERDLIINKLPADALEKWNAAINKGLDRIISKASSKEAFDRLRQYLNEYRKLKPGEPR